MEEGIRDSIAMITNIIDKMEQDFDVLTGSLEGEVMDLYRMVTRRELDRLQNARKLLFRLEH